MDTTAESVLKEVKPGRDALDLRARQYDHCYEVYRASEPKGAKKQPWESKLRVPYAQQVIDTCLVNIIGGAPRAKIRPRREQDVASAKAMQVILDYHVGEDHLAEKLPTFVQQALIYGVTAAKNQWLYKETTRQTRQFHPNPLDPGTPLSFDTQQKVTLRDGPTFEPWDVYDIWWDPDARDVDQARYIVLRSWLSKEELLENSRTDQNPYGMFNAERVLELIKDGPASGTRTSAQERFNGGQQDKRKDKFQVLEVWKDDTVTVVANDTKILRYEPNPYWHGKKPVVITQVRPDLFEIQGISETELIDHLQQAAWSVQNMRMDNWHLTVQRGFTLRETAPIQPKDVVARPRFVWQVGDHDDIQPVNMQPLPPEAYREQESLKGDMQLVTGINPYVSGSDLSSVDQNTATGVTALQEVASRLLRFKARQIAYKGLQRTLEQWGELVQQFMDHTEAIRIEGPQGYDWTNVDPQQIVGNYDYSVEGTEESLSRQQERGESIALLNAFAPFIQVPGFNIDPVLEKVAKAYDLGEKVLVKPVQAPAAAPQQQGQPGQQNGMPVPAENGQMVGGQALPPQVLQAMQNGQ